MQITAEKSSSVLLKRGRSSGLYTSKKIPPPLGILNLIVIDQMQKQKLGAKLLSEGIQIARAEKVKKIKVQIFSGNKAMKKMLTRENFTLTPSEKDLKIINEHLEL